MSELNPIPTPAYTPTSAHNADTFTPRAHQHNDPTGVFGFLFQALSVIKTKLPSTSNQ